MAVLSKTAIRDDPVLNHNFVISLIDSSSTLSILKTAALSALMDVVVGGFTECSGLEMSLDVHEHEEGGRNGEVLCFPTRVKWGNITLRKGVAASTALWDWLYAFREGKGQRRDGVIALMTELRLPHNIWYFRRGLPVKYSGPALNATENNVAVESMEIKHEGVYQVPYLPYAAAAAGAITELAT